MVVVCAPAQAQQDPNVRTPVQLEQWLMEGAYNKVLNASKQHPSEFHAALMAQLTNTVRCVECHAWLMRVASMRRCEWLVTQLTCRGGASLCWVMDT